MWLVTKSKRLLMKLKKYFKNLAILLMRPHSHWLLNSSVSQSWITLCGIWVSPKMQRSETFPIVTKVNKINTKIKTKSFSTFDFTILYTTIHHNLLNKVLSEAINFVFKSKTQSRISFWKKILHKTNFDWCNPTSNHKMLFYHWKPSAKTRDWHSYGHGSSSIPGKPSSIFISSEYVQQLISKWSSRAYKFRGASMFIGYLCTINDGGEYPKQLELKLKRQREQLRIIYNTSFSVNGTSFLSLLCVCLIFRAVTTNIL